ncbi:hypothetical protein [Amycolatopsis samaneae]|uniref:Uncharacterized protein n=1 Tax=Amycolatopsis samaneae TaxID=664691 RepID=A0ABW5G6T2_9PSEU
MRIRRIVLVGTLVACFSTASAVAETPVAGASFFGCRFYLLATGHGGIIVDIGCNYGAKGDRVLCEGSLQVAGVPVDLAKEACRRAALP